MKDLPMREQIHRVVKMVRFDRGTIMFDLECGHWTRGTIGEGVSVDKAMQHGSVWKRCGACEEEREWKETHRNGD